MLMLMGFFLLLMKTEASGTLLLFCEDVFFQARRKVVHIMLKIDMKLIFWPCTKANVS